MRAFIYVMDCRIRFREMWKLIYQTTIGNLRNNMGNKKKKCLRLFPYISNFIFRDWRQSYFKIFLYLSVNKRRSNLWAKFDSAKWRPWFSIFFNWTAIEEKEKVKTELRLAGRGGFLLVIWKPPNHLLISIKIKFSLFFKFFPKIKKFYQNVLVFGHFCHP